MPRIDDGSCSNSSIDGFEGDEEEEEEEEGVSFINSDEEFSVEEDGVLSSPLSQPTSRRHHSSAHSVGASTSMDTASPATTNEDAVHQELQHIVDVENIASQLDVHDQLFHNPIAEDRFCMYHNSVSAAALELRQSHILTPPHGASPPTATVSQSGQFLPNDELSVMLGLDHPYAVDDDNFVLPPSELLSHIRPPEQPWQVEEDNSSAMEQNLPVFHTVRMSEEASHHNATQGKTFDDIASVSKATSTQHFKPGLSSHDITRVDAHSSRGGCRSTSSTSSTDRSRESSLSSTSYQRRPFSGKGHKLAKNQQQFKSMESSISPPTAGQASKPTRSRRTRYIRSNTSSVPSSSSDTDDEDREPDWLPGGTSMAASRRYASKPGRSSGRGGRGRRGVGGGGAPSYKSKSLAAAAATAAQMFRRTKKPEVIDLDTPEKKPTSATSSAPDTTTESLHDSTNAGDDDDLANMTLLAPEYVGPITEALKASGITMTELALNPTDVFEEFQCDGAVIGTAGEVEVQSQPSCATNALLSFKSCQSSVPAWVSASSSMALNSSACPVFTPRQGHLASTSPHCSRNSAPPIITLDSKSDPIGSTVVSSVATTVSRSQGAFIRSISSLTKSILAKASPNSGSSSPSVLQLPNSPTPNTPRPYSPASLPETTAPLLHSMMSAQSGHSLGLCSPLPRSVIESSGNWLSPQSSSSPLCKSRYTRPSSPLIVYPTITSVVSAPRTPLPSSTTNLAPTPPHTPVTDTRLDETNASRPSTPSVPYGSMVLAIMDNEGILQAVPNTFTPVKTLQSSVATDVADALMTTERHQPALPNCDRQNQNVLSSISSSKNTFQSAMSLSNKLVSNFGSQNFCGIAEYSIHESTLPSSEPAQTTLVSATVTHPIMSCSPATLCGDTTRIRLSASCVDEAISTFDSLDSLVAWGGPSVVGDTKSEDVTSNPSFSPSYPVTSTSNLATCETSSVSRDQAIIPDFESFVSESFMFEEASKLLEKTDLFDDLSDQVNASEADNFFASPSPTKTKEIDFSPLFSAADALDIVPFTYAMDDIERDTVSDSVECDSAPVEYSSTYVGHGSARIDLGSASPVEHGAAPIAHGSAPIAHGSASIALSSASIEPGSAPVELGSAPVELGPASVELGSASVKLGFDPVKCVSASVERGSASVERGSASVERGSASVERGSASVERGSASVERGSASVERGSASVERGSASVERGSASVERVSASVERGSASVERGSASVERGSASVERGSASVERGSASVERVSASVERGSASVERGSASVEPESASVEPGSGSVEHESSSVEHGSGSVEHCFASVKHGAASVERAFASIEHGSANIKLGSAYVECRSAYIECSSAYVEHEDISVKHVSGSVENVSGSVEYGSASIEPGSVERDLDSVCVPSQCTIIKSCSIPTKLVSTFVMPDFLKSNPTSVKGDSTSVEGDATYVKSDSLSTESNSTFFECKDTLIKRDSTSPKHDSFSNKHNSTSTEHDSAFIKHDTTSTKRESTSTKRDSTSTKRDSTFTKRDSTSTKRDSTKRDSTSTKRDSTSTKRDSTSTKRDSASTKRDSTSTKRDSTSTKRDSTSNKHDSTSIKYESTFSKRESTPTKCESTSTKRESTSTQRDSTTTKRDSISTKHDSTSTKRDSTSTKRDFTSTKRDSTSTKRDSTSTKRASTSTKRASTSTKRDSSSTSCNPSVMCGSTSIKPDFASITRDSTSMETDSFSIKPDSSMIKPYSSTSIELNSISIQRDTTSVIPASISIKCNSTSIEHNSTSIEHNSTSIEHNSTSIEHNSTTIEHNSTSIERNSTSIERNSTSIERNSTSIERNSTSIERNSTSIERNFTSIERNFTDKTGGHGLILSDRKKLSDLSHLINNSVPDKIQNELNVDDSFTQKSRPLSPASESLSTIVTVATIKDQQESDIAFKLVGNHSSASSSEVRDQVLSTEKVAPIDGKVWFSQQIPYSSSIPSAQLCSSNEKTAESHGKLRIMLGHDIVPLLSTDAGTPVPLIEQTSHPHPTCASLTDVPGSWDNEEQSAACNQNAESPNHDALDHTYCLSPNKRPGDQSGAVTIKGSSNDMLTSLADSPTQESSLDTVSYTNATNCSSTDLLLADSPKKEYSYTSSSGASSPETIEDSYSRIPDYMRLCTIKVEKFDGDDQDKENEPATRDEALIAKKRIKLSDYFKRKPPVPSEDRAFPDIAAVKQEPVEESSTAVIPAKSATPGLPKLAAQSVTSMLSTNVPGFEEVQKKDVITTLTAEFFANPGGAPNNEKLVTPPSNQDASLVTIGCALAATVVVAPKLELLVGSLPCVATARPSSADEATPSAVNNAFPSVAVNATSAAPCVLHSAAVNGAPSATDSVLNLDATRAAAANDLDSTAAIATPSAAANVTHSAAANASPSAAVTAFRSIAANALPSTASNALLPIVAKASPSSSTNISPLTVVVSAPKLDDPSQSAVAKSFPLSLSCVKRKNLDIVRPEDIEEGELLEDSLVSATVITSFNTEQLPLSEMSTRRAGNSVSKDVPDLDVSSLTRKKKRSSAKNDHGSTSTATTGNKEQPARYRKRAGDESSHSCSSQEARGPATKKSRHHSCSSTPLEASTRGSKRPARSSSSSSSSSSASSSSSGSDTSHVSVTEAKTRRQQRNYRKRQESPFSLESSQSPSPVRRKKEKNTTRSPEQRRRKSYSSSSSSRSRSRSRSSRRRRHRYSLSRSRSRESYKSRKHKSSRRRSRSFSPESVYSLGCGCAGGDPRRAVHSSLCQYYRPPYSAKPHYPPMHHQYGPPHKVLPYDPPPMHYGPPGYNNYHPGPPLYPPLGAAGHSMMARRSDEMLYPKPHNLRVKQVEERLVVYVGRISDGITKTALKERFSSFGTITDISLHFREKGDNYGFITYSNSTEANHAIENGNKGQEQLFDLCFGGRRQFCRQQYKDLDALPGNNNGGEAPAADFDTLLKQMLSRR